MTSRSPAGSHAVSRPPHRPRWWWWVVAATLVTLMAAIWVLADAAGPDPDPVAAPPAPVQPVTPLPATTAPVGPLTTLEPRAEPYPVGPGPGAVAPGRYSTTGPTSSDTPCYWARLRGSTHTQSDIIESSRRLHQFTVGPRDKWVQVFGCTFTKQG